MNLRQVCAHVGKTFGDARKKVSTKTVDVRRALILGGTRFFDSGGESENSRHIFGARSHRIFLTASDDVRYELLRLENIVSYPQRADALQCADFVRACRYHIDTELSR